MKICGFTIIRNAILYDYPVLASIHSILPICDQFVIAVGKSEDDTLKLVQSINSPKIKIIETIWDDTLRAGGKVLAEETNKAFDAIGIEFDWCFYLQSDEVIHEKDHQKILEALRLYKDLKQVDGLLFNYIHFYASYNFIGISRKWYRKEIRIIRNDKSIRSFRDAQGFRKNNQKLIVKQVDATVYHYGWVKHPALQMAKQLNFNKFWHADSWLKVNIPEKAEYDYSRADIIEKFKGKHPEVMKDSIEKMNWEVPSDPTKFKAPLKFRITKFIEDLTGFRIGEYKNYTLK